MVETKLSLQNVTRDDWLRLRKSGLGGSDAGAVCGLNPYSSPLQVFCDKTTEEVQDHDNESMRQGRDLEEYVAKRFMEETGKKVRRSNFMYRSEEHLFMIADVDRLIVGEDAGLECKTANAYNADKWKDGKIPAHYIIQCCHYMAVTGKKSWYIAVVILGQEFKYAKISWDDEIIRDLITVEENFWKNHILTGIAPKPNGSDGDTALISKRFPTSATEEALPLDSFESRLYRRAEILEQMKTLTLEQERIDQEIKLYMGDHAAAKSENFRVRWQSVNSERLDSKALKNAEPEIYRKYTKSISSRRFVVSPAT